MMLKISPSLPIPGKALSLQDDAALLLVAVTVLCWGPLRLLELPDDPHQLQETLVHVHANLYQNIKLFKNYTQNSFF